MTRQVVCPSMLLHGRSTPGNSQFAKLLFAALVYWMKELLLITDYVLYLIVLTWLFHMLWVCVEKRAMSSSVLPWFKRPPRQYAFCIGWRRRGGSRYKLPWPMFLSVSVVSDVIRTWFVVLDCICGQRPCCLRRCLLYLFKVPLSCPPFLGGGWTNFAGPVWDYGFWHRMWLCVVWRLQLNIIVQ